LLIKDNSEPIEIKVEISFEKVSSFDELYQELDRVGEITVESKSLFGKKIETKYSAEQVKEMIKK